MNQSIAELKVNGMIYGGWKNVRITRSIEQMAGTFELEISERWPGQSKRTPIKPGEMCQVLLNGQPVITGRIDTVMIDYDGQNHSVRVAGRDKTGILVDCSAAYLTGQWHNVKIEQIAENLLGLYGIKVETFDLEDIKAFTSYSIQEGESIFECLERAARMRGVLLTSNPEGDLVITRAMVDGEGLVLEEGVNIKAARAEFSWKDRYSEYIVKGHGRLFADGDHVHSAPAHAVGDPAISHFRRLIVLAENHSDNASLEVRAEWERNVRRGRGCRGSITVQGWEHKFGLWLPNTIVSVTSPLIYLTESKMLIVGCSYTLSEQGGSLTELAIARPDAFQLLEGMPKSNLFGKIRTKEQRERREKVEDWSTM